MKDTAQQVSDFLRSVGEVAAVTVDGTHLVIDREARYWAAKAGESAAGLEARRVVALDGDGAVLGVLSVEREDAPPPSDATAAAYQQAYRDMQRMSGAASAAGQLLLGEAMAALRQAGELRADAARERRQVASQLATVQRTAAMQRARAQLPAGSDDEDDTSAGGVERQVADALAAQLPAALMSVLPELAKSFGITLPKL